MSNEINIIKDNIMNKIKKGDIKMHSSLYFTIGYFITISGVVLSFFSSIFFVGLIRYTFRFHGPMGQYRLDKLLSNLSWWLPVLAILALSFGIYLMNKYKFLYKINLKTIIISTVLSVLLIGFIVDLVGINDYLIKKGNMREQRRHQNRSLDKPIQFR